MSGTRDYLSFRVDAEEYAIPIEHVQEIRAFTVITPIPTVPAYVRGVMNLRGAVSPVVGLREKFGLETKPVDRFSVVLVVTATAGSCSRRSTRSSRGG